MESPQEDRRVLRDLALIYIALAHSTDQELDEDEITTIAERLRRWQQESSATVLAALKEALRDYTQEDARPLVQEAVYHVRETFPQDLRQFLLDDLMDIALADNRMLFAESMFISELMRAWNVHPAGDEAGSWSLLSASRTQNDWSAVHDLALIYLTLAHRTDDDLSEAEMDTISQKIGEWLPDASEEDVKHLVREVLTVYVQGPDERLFDASVESVSQAIPPHQRSALLDDLQHIAEADGTVLEAEQHLIDRLTRSWQIPAAS